MNYKEMRMKTQAIINYHLDLIEFTNPENWQEMCDLADETPSRYKANMENIERLLKEGAPIEAKNNRGDTLLHFAVQSLYPDLVELLLMYGATPFSRNNNYLMPEELLLTWQMMTSLKPEFRKAMEKIEQLLHEAENRIINGDKDDENAIFRTIGKHDHL